MAKKAKVVMKTVREGENHNKHVKHNEGVESRRTGKWKDLGRFEYAQKYVLYFGLRRWKYFNCI